MYEDKTKINTENYRCALAPYIVLFAHNVEKSYIPTCTVCTKTKQKYIQKIIVALRARPIHSTKQKYIQKIIVADGRTDGQ